MKYAVDTSVLIDHLRGHQAAVELVAQLVNDDAEFVSSFVIRAEVLAGMRPGEERRTRLLLDLIQWDPVSEPESEAAGELGRRHLKRSPGIDTPDLLLAEVAERHGAEVLTTNLKHFRPMFPGLRAPYTY